MCLQGYLLCNSKFYIQKQYIYKLKINYFLVFIKNMKEKSIKLIYNVVFKFKCNELTVFRYIQSLVRFFLYRILAY